MRPATDEEQERAFDALNAARDAFHAAPSDERRLDWRMQAASYLRSTGMTPADLAKSIDKIEAECRAALDRQAHKEAAE